MMDNSISIDEPHGFSPARIPPMIVSLVFKDFVTGWAHSPSSHNERPNANRTRPISPRHALLWPYVSRGHLVGQTCVSLEGLGTQERRTAMAFDVYYSVVCTMS